jgi:hypothetical protein
MDQRHRPTIQCQMFEPRIRASCAPSPVFNTYPTVAPLPSHRGCILAVFCQFTYPPTTTKHTPHSLIAPRHRHEQACRKEREQCAGSIDIRVFSIWCARDIQRRLVTALVRVGAAGPLGHLGPQRGGLLPQPVEAGQHNQGEGARGHTGARHQGAGGGGPAGGMGALRPRMYIQSA